MIEEQKSSGAVTTLATIAFVFGLIGMLGSFIPCIGAVAFYVGIPAAIVGIIALIVAKEQNAKNTFAIVALVISLIGVAISGWHYFSIKSVGERSEQEIHRMFD